MGQNAVLVARSIVCISRILRVCHPRIVYDEFILVGAWAKPHIDVKFTSRIWSGHGITTHPRGRAFKITGDFNSCWALALFAPINKCMNALLRIAVVACRRAGAAAQSLPRVYHDHSITQLCIGHHVRPGIIWIRIEAASEHDETDQRKQFQVFHVSPSNEKNALYGANRLKSSSSVTWWPPRRKVFSRFAFDWTKSCTNF